MTDRKQRVVIGGAGPAGLTAALELLRASDAYEVIVVETAPEVGGLSKTVNHNGNRLDIGGHRFFSHSDWVMNWWRKILPIASLGDEAVDITYHNKTRPIQGGVQNADVERVMLVRNRLSRIYYAGQFFAYPVKANLDTARKLGFGKVAAILASYLRARVFPRRPETSLEDFLLNRFGRVLYETFFKDYTEKVWGVPCNTISAEWGAQRIKGLSILSALRHAARSILPKPFKDLLPTRETSLIERFLYPKYGPGQLWEVVAEEIRQRGGEIRLGCTVVGLSHDAGRITVATLETLATGAHDTLNVDWFFSTLPVKELIAGLSPPAPPAVQAVASGLQYRDFITVGVLLKTLQPTPGAIADSPLHLVPDNWIYIQDKGVKVGRLQVFNNWSPFMVADAATVWIGLEYFCDEGDDLWQQDDTALAAFALQELATLGLADPADCLDTVILRVPKAYPGYFGSFGQFDIIRRWVDAIPNLFLIGRNGMHRYNNQDHSMLTAKMAVAALLSGDTDRSALWAVNIDDTYHEER